MKTKKRKIRLIMKEILFWILSLIVIVPFLIVVFNAFKTKTEAINMQLTIPAEWHFENLRTVWEQGDILHALGNSIRCRYGAGIFHVRICPLQKQDKRESVCLSIFCNGPDGPGEHGVYRKSIAGAEAL